MSVVAAPKIVRMKKLATRLGAEEELVICEKTVDMPEWRQVLDELAPQLEPIGALRPRIENDRDVIMDAHGAEVLYVHLMRRRSKSTAHVRGVLRRLAKTGHAYSWPTSGARQATSEPVQPR